MNATQANVRCHVVPPNLNRTRGTKDMYLEVAVGTGAGFARVDKGDAAWRRARARRPVGLVERLVSAPHRQSGARTWGRTKNKSEVSIWQCRERVNSSSVVAC